MSTCSTDTYSCRHILHPATEISDADHARLEWARACIKQMTLEEKIPFLHQHSPGIPRLGIGPFITGTEALHGIAWRGQATSFPQSVGMAATWDPSLLCAAGQVVSAEAREIKKTQPDLSLTVWAPVINTLRHPLWGRNEEGYTEDPVLNSALGTAYCQGLRGSGSNWNVIPTLKHFLAYSNEIDRSASSSQLSARMIEEYELPAFLHALHSQAAGSVMLSYNLVNGRPAHLSDMVNSRLRQAVADPDLLFVVTDAGAPSNLFRSEKFMTDPSQAYAAMVKAGVDSFTDHDADPTETIMLITQALTRGFLSEEDINHAVVRQLLARARTGEFGPTASSHAVQETSQAEQSGAMPRSHARALSREIATRSAVLLAHTSANSEQTGALPLPAASTIALIGDGGQRVLRDWYSGTFIEPVSIGQALACDFTVKQCTGLHEVELTVPVPADSPAIPPSEHDWPLMLASDHSLRLGIPADSGPISLDTAALEILDFGIDVIAMRHTITGRFVTVDEYGQLQLGPTELDGWVVQELFERTVTPQGRWLVKHCATGRYVGIERHTCALTLRTTSKASGTPLGYRTLTSTSQAVARVCRDAQVIVAVIGNDPHVHGRETSDRPHTRPLGHDAVILSELRALKGNTPVVLIVKSSYPYDLSDYRDDVDAIIWTSHLGEAEGEAIADLLAGRRDFSGRLAQTWPIDSCLSSIFDYDLPSSKQTYLYGQASCFPFGHGLTVDPIAWSRPRWTCDEKTVTVKVDLSAPAMRRTQGALHEVVQVYAQYSPASFSRRAYQLPTTRLVAFSCVEVDDSTTATLSFSRDSLALWASDQDRWEIPDGPVTLRLARSSAVSSTVSSYELPALGSITSDASSVSDSSSLRDAAEGIIPSTSLTQTSVTVPARRAEQLNGLARCALTPSHGEELRPSFTRGTAVFTLPAGSQITALNTVPLQAPERTKTYAVVLDQATGQTAPLPYTVTADPGYPTGSVHIALSGPLALRSLTITQN